jgi:hypothetical protein
MMGREKLVMRAAAGPWHVPRMGREDRAVMSSLLSTPFRIVPVADHTGTRILLWDTPIPSHVSCSTISFCVTISKRHGLELSQGWIYLLMARVHVWILLPSKTS